MVKQYVNIGVPKPLAAAIDALIEERYLGFVSRGEVLKHVLRQFLLELIRNKVLPPQKLQELRSR